MSDEDRSGLYYFGTSRQVQLGDRVTIKKLFREIHGVVAYIPKVSEYRPDLHDDWLIRLDNGSFISMGYAPYNPLAQPKRNIRFQARGESGIVTPEENLGPE
jgi:hypothetical protein